eukprot:scaffold3987_cov118-Isochrysis_galbana.AAC.7
MTPPSQRFRGPRHHRPAKRTALQPPFRRRSSVRRRASAGRRPPRYSTCRSPRGRSSPPHRSAECSGGSGRPASAHARTQALCTPCRSQCSAQQSAPTRSR